MQSIWVFYESLKIAWNHSKNHLSWFKYKYFCFKKNMNNVSWIYKNEKLKL